MDLVDDIKLRILRQGGYLGQSGWTFNAITCILVREAEEDLKQTTGREAMDMEQTGVMQPEARECQ